MANIINYTYQSEKIIKDYGTTTKAEQELFEGKYEGCKYIYGGCLWSDKACEYIADDGNGNISSIKLKPQETFEFSQIRPWKTLKIKSTIGTAYNCSFSC